MRRKLNVKLLVIVVGTLLVLSISAHFLHRHQIRQNAYRLLERADRALEADQPEKAITYFGQYLILVPDDPDTVQKYALTLDARTKTVAERVRLILLMEQVLRAKPSEHELRLRLIANLIKLDRIAEAIDNLRKLQRDGHDKAKVLHMLGWCLEAKKDYVQAVRAFEDAIKLQPKQIESYALLAAVLQERLTQPDEADKVMEDMVQANLDSAQAYLVRARFHRGRGDEKNVESDLDTAYKLAPDRPEVILAVAHAARARGNWEQATKLLEDGVKRFPDHAEFWKEIIWAKIRADQRDEAIAFAQDGLRHFPQSTELAILLIDLLIDQKQYAPAQKKIDELLQSGIKPALPNYLQARLKAAHQEWTDAIQLLEQVRQDLGPNSEWNGRVNVLLGISYRHLGDHEQELRAFRRAVKDEPNWPMANFGLGSVLLSMGRLDEASQGLEPLRSTKNAPPGYWILLGRVRLARQLRLPEAERNWEEVENALANAEKANPAGAEVAIGRAELFLAKGDFAAAKTLLEKARADSLKAIALPIALADLLTRQKQFDAAEAILNEALTASKAAEDRLEVQLAQSRLWGQRANPMDRKKLARLTEEAPKASRRLERARLMRALGDTWHHLGEAARAEAIWRDLAAAFPGDLRSRALLLDAALDRRQPAAAQKWIDEIRAIEGESGALWRYGAIALQIQEAHGRRRQLDDARKSLVELDRLHKSWPRIPLLAAAIFELEGHSHKAIEEYLRALDLGEAPPRTMAKLLALLVERREFGKAESALGKYEQNAPLTPELARLGAEIVIGLRDKRYARLATTRAEQAVVLPARDYRDLLFLARVYHAVEDNARAEDRLREAVEQAPHAPDAWIAWMGHLALTNQGTRAEQDLERMRNQLPAGRHALTIARCFEALRDPQRASKAYYAALQAQPDDFVTLAHAADFYRRDDQTTEAQKLYLRLLDPNRAVPADYVIPARRHLAVLLASTGVAGRNQALELLEANKKARGPTLADQRVRLFVQSLSSKPAQLDAISKFQDSLPVELPTPEERVLLAQMLEGADQFTQARLQLVEAVDESPTPQLLTRYVDHLIRAEELEEAERQFTRLQALEPGSTRVRDLGMKLARAKAQ